MVNQEYLDIDVVDENNETTGRATDYFTLHKENLPHRAAHVWFVEDGKLVFQKRGKGVTFAGYYDCTAGGHVDTGESAKSAAIRETFEECGVKISENDISDEYVFRFKQQLKTDWFENEFRHIYFVYGDKFDFKLSDEIEEFIKVPVETLKEFFKENSKKFVPFNEKYYDFIFNILEKKK